jgi:signal transduction histidine kinase
VHVTSSAVCFAASDRGLLLERVRGLVASKERLVYALSHELRSPINGMLGERHNVVWLTICTDSMAGLRLYCTADRLAHAAVLGHQQQQRATAVAV